MGAAVLLPGGAGAAYATAATTDGAVRAPAPGPPPTERAPRADRDTEADWGGGADRDTEADWGGGADRNGGGHRDGGTDRDTTADRDGGTHRNGERYQGERDGQDAPPGRDGGGHRNTGADRDSAAVQEESAHRD